MPCDPVSSMETSQSTKPPGAFSGIMVRIVLTVSILALMWVCLRMVSLTVHFVPDATRMDDESLYPGAGSMKADSVAEKRARFPLPLFPGARNAEFGEMLFNGKPFFRCDYEVIAPAERVLQYYRSQLMSAGWRDVTEESVRQAAIVQQPEQHEILDFQNETFLRYYDNMMRTQASFSKPGRHILIAVKDGRKSWASQVGIHYIEYGSPGELSHDLQRMLGLEGDMLKSDGPATFSQTMGSQKAETTIRTSRSGPEDFCRSLVNDFLRQGWREVDIPEKAASPNAGQTACLVNDNQMLLVHVTRDAQNKLSRAIMTRLGSP